MDVTNRGGEENSLGIESLFELVKAVVVGSVESLLEVGFIDIGLRHVGTGARCYISPFLDLHLGQIVTDYLNLRRRGILCPRGTDDGVHDRLPPGRVYGIVRCTSARELILHVESKEKSLGFDYRPDGCECLIEFLLGCPVLAGEEAGCGLKVGLTDEFFGEVGLPGWVERLVLGHDRGVRDIQLVELIVKWLKESFHLDGREFWREQRSHEECTVKNTEVRVHSRISHCHECLKVDLDSGPESFRITGCKVEGDSGDGDIRVGFDDG